MSTNTGQHHQTTEQIAGKAHEAVDRAAETAAKAEEYAREHASQADDVLDRANGYVRANPLIAIAIAFISGMLFAWLKRRN